MTASFIPVFTTYMREKSEEEVWDFANKLFWTLALVVAVDHGFGNGVFAVRGAFVCGEERRARAGGRAESRLFSRTCSFVALAALAMGILNCFHMFGLPAATPVVLNVATILFTMRRWYGNTSRIRRRRSWSECWSAACCSF